MRKTAAEKLTIGERRRRHYGDPTVFVVKEIPEWANGRIVTVRPLGGRVTKLFAASTVARWQKVHP